MSASTSPPEKSGRSSPRRRPRRRRWNAHRRLTTASAVLAMPQESPVIAAQREVGGDDRGEAVQERLGPLASDVLDRLDVPTIQRELEGALLDLERLEQRSS